MEPFYFLRAYLVECSYPGLIPILRAGRASTGDQLGQLLICKIFLLWLTTSRAYLHLLRPHHYRPWRRADSLQDHVLGGESRGL